MPPKLAKLLQKRKKKLFIPVPTQFIDLCIRKLLGAFVERLTEVYSSLLRFFYCSSGWLAPQQELVRDFRSLPINQKKGFRFPHFVFLAKPLAPLIALRTSGTRVALLMLFLGNLVAISLLPSVVSSGETSRSVQGGGSSSHTNTLKVSPEQEVQLVTAHAFLLWSSVGFLMPLGVMIIRMSHRFQSVKGIKVLFYTHVIVQTLAILLATAAAVLSLATSKNSFSNTHQRIGLALYGLIWIQPVLAFLRPRRGMKARSVWYLMHWLLGAGVCLLGVANIYIGLHGYHVRTSRRVSLWTALFTAEVSVMAFVYLMQDRWDYVMRQGVVMQVAEQITPTNHAASSK